MLVALVGSIMRYKIVFDLPIFEQKNLLDAHSHFAFYGWITSALYLLILIDIKTKIPDLKTFKYFIVCILNLIGAYGMLIAFTYNDYYWLSILFSTVSLVCGWIYWILLYLDVRKKSIKPAFWYLGGLFFAFISSAGVFYIGYLTGTKQITIQTLHASIFYYLHFQYNGFYVFSCIGLLLSMLQRRGIFISPKQNRIIFYSFFISCLLCYGLSLLWMDLPFWYYVGIVLGTLIQSTAVFFLFRFLRRNWREIKSKFTSLQIFVFLFVGIAFGIKILLQQISIFPSIAQFAFDFRPVAIAFLHLILLMGISSFLMERILFSSYFQTSFSLINSFKFLLFFIFLNQLFLGVSGFSSLFHYSIPFEKEILLIVGILILLTITFLLFKLNVKKKYCI